MPTLRAVAPDSVLYALHGQVVHSINERHAQGAILSEERLKNDITGSFKLMKALSIYKTKVDTGEVYKSGAKKGLPKFRTELRFDGVRDFLD